MKTNKRYGILTIFIICTLFMVACGGSASEDGSSAPEISGAAGDATSISDGSEADSVLFSVGAAEDVSAKSDKSVKNGTEETDASAGNGETSKKNSETGDKSGEVSAKNGETGAENGEKPASADDSASDRIEVTVENDTQDPINNLKVAGSASQIMTVAASGSSATLTLYSKNADGYFEKALSASASIGSNGIGKTKEGDRKTPKGKYHFTRAFGTKENPGSQIAYTKVDSTCFWVDDSNSAYYNKFVKTSEVNKDWKSAEDLSHSGSSYNYALAIDYNSACTPGAGSAIFLHCTPTGGAGCIAVKESVMKSLLQQVKPDCILIIDTPDGILNY